MSVYSVPLLGFHYLTRVARALDQIIEWRGEPTAVRCDNGPEHISQILADWAAEQGIRLEFIQPVNPQQNAYVERYNRTVRYCSSLGSMSIS